MEFHAARSNDTAILRNLTTSTSQLDRLGNSALCTSQHTALYLCAEQAQHRMLLSVQGALLGLDPASMCGRP